MMSHRPVRIDELESWVLAGARWRVVDISDAHVVVDMCTCTGEPMERLESADPGVIRYLRTAHLELDET